MDWTEPRCRSRKGRSQNETPRGGGPLSNGRDEN